MSLLVECVIGSFSGLLYWGWFFYVYRRAETKRSNQRAEREQRQREKHDSILDSLGDYDLESKHPESPFNRLTGKPRYQPITRDTSSDMKPLTPEMVAIIRKLLLPEEQPAMSSSPVSSTRIGNAGESSSVSEVLISDISNAPRIQLSEAGRC